MIQTRAMSRKNDPPLIILKKLFGVLKKFLKQKEIKSNSDKGTSTAAPERFDKTVPHSENIRADSITI
jgi:hypothetical protein